MRGRTAALLCVATACLISQTAGATGLLLPSDRNLPPLAIKYHRVSATITGGVAKTKLTEVFVNSTGRRLEATYIFPIPVGAALTDFAMYINGKRQSGELVEAKRARKIYEEIVRRMRDPGLLEYMDGRLLRLRVFPIEPRSEQKIELSYAHSLPFHGGVYGYTFPLKTGHKASKVLEDFTLSVDITSQVAIKNIYSPTHEVGVARRDDHHATAGLEQEGAVLDRDFKLYYTVTDKDFGLNLLTYRPKGKDGFFALMLAPGADVAQEKVMPKDVCFVLDTSGSMKQEGRIKSAKAALEFCLKALNPRDRFALLTFSTAVDTFGEGLSRAKKGKVEEAVGHLSKLKARGGTDLCGAVVKALRMATDEDRPYLVVLITDGKPTVGTTNPDEIVEAVKEANRSNVRVFTFGIAESLNVPLLDRIAEATKGYSEYVSPGSEIEMEVSAFFSKVSDPILTGLELSFGKVKVKDVYPPELPDLFRGSQLVAFGRYEGSGETAVELTGLSKGEKRRFAYDAQFPEVDVEKDFIATLWARRKIAYLLDQIRLHGDSKELVDEVVRLSKEYGIATPYTSYLVLEDEDAYRRHGILRGPVIGERAEAPAPEAVRVMEQRARDLSQKGIMLRTRGGEGAAGAVAGPKAIRFSEDLKEWKHAKTAAAPKGRAGAEAKITRVGERTFVEIRGVFVDTQFEDEMDTLKLKWGSDAYFTALEVMPELKKFLALSERVIVVIGKKALVVGEEGKEKISRDDFYAFFRD